MKNILKYFIALLIFSGCDSEDAGDCFQTAGTIIQQEFSIADFNKILINERVELIVKEGNEQQVIIESGENLMNDIIVEVSNNQLIISNYNDCNYLRDYGITKVLVTSPNLTEIRNSSELPVRSDGVITYPTLRLISDDYESDFLNVGDFHMNIENESLFVTSNGISNYYISGQTTNLTVGFFAGDSRFEGQNLFATNINITHKSTNDMLVNPQESIIGNIYSLGDVISHNQPEVIDVTEHYQGKLIFN
ncbi:head GIN domain-containing protein [Urechidicola croceus]|uniref:Putative auto-transporter adhesin head GIN domain-containing protein n=1 Tax=Urechidicola croceus TaxID=1850246 RepID=A0A1D8P7I1_9FLAO|nr:head GIN domain-containing protein [Urechidicola croceus]AOW20533.1 hypothetical protein LPB138_07515 [Urechidicola croceus]